MSQQPIIYNSTGNTAEVIDFEEFLTDSSSGSSDYLMRRALRSTEFKKILETIMFDNYIKYHYSISERGDDPYDAIYLSELEPDIVNRSDVQRLVRFSNIQDLSQTIEFIDDWED